MTPQHPAAPETEGMCPVCRLVREEPDEPIEPGDYYTVDPTSPSRCPSCGCVPGRESEAAARVAWAREHRTVIRSHGCDSPAPECFCGSPATPHRFPAPETETDANGLTDAEREALNVAVDEAETCVCCGGDYGSTHIYAAVKRIVAERVRVVEGDRDAARARVDEVVQLNTEKARHQRELMARLAEVAEVAGDRGNEVQAQRDRAESAEAAREAEKAAHERRVKRAGALLDAWEHDAPGLVDPVFAGRLREVLRRDPAPVRLREDDTLGGGEAR